MVDYFADPREPMRDAHIVAVRSNQRRRPVETLSPSESAACAFDYASVPLRVLQPTSIDRSLDEAVRRMERDAGCGRFTVPPSKHIPQPVVGTTMYDTTFSYE